MAELPGATHRSLWHSQVTIHDLVQQMRSTYREATPDWNACTPAHVPSACPPSANTPLSPAPSAFPAPPHAPHTHVSLLALAETFSCQLRPGIPSLLGHIPTWKTALTSTHVGICPLSTLWPSPLRSRALPDILSTGCSGRRDAPTGGMFPLCTASIWCPVYVQTTLGTVQAVHTCTSVYRTFLTAICHWSLELDSWFRLCPLDNNGNVWSMCWPLTASSLPSSRWGYIERCDPTRCTVTCTTCIVVHVVPCLPGGDQNAAKWWPNNYGPCGSWLQCRGHQGPRHARWLLLLVAAMTMGPGALYV